MPIKRRLYDVLIERKLARTRSQVEMLVDLRKVLINGAPASSPNNTVDLKDNLVVVGESYVSRAAFKLASITNKLKLNFKGKTILDVGSSTGGFTDYVLQHGAKKVIAVDVGTDQLHPLLRNNPKVELHEKTDIRDFKTNQVVDIVVIDVSFISLRQVLPSVANLSHASTEIVAMVKPQFEAGTDRKHKGVIKNDHMRRDILKSFEDWARQYFIILGKADSEVAGSKGNRERFYVLKTVKFLK